MSQQTLEVMAGSVDQLKTIFKQQMDQLADRLDNASAVPSATVSSVATDLASFRTFVMGALQLLQDQIQALGNVVDGMEMRSRRKILLLHGIPEENHEDTGSVIEKVLVQKLKIPGFTKSAISRCHRMGRSATGDRPRPILFKLHDTSQRGKIWSSKKCLKSTGITMSEFLTKSRHDTFMAARQHFGVSKCWTQDGSVFVIGANGVRHLINNQQELEKILSQDASKQKTVIKESAASAVAVAATAGTSRSKRVITTTSKK